MQRWPLRNVISLRCSRTAMRTPPTSSSSRCRTKEPRQIPTLPITITTITPLHQDRECRLIPHTRYRSALSPWRWEWLPSPDHFIQSNECSLSLHRRVMCHCRPSSHLSVRWSICALPSLSITALCGERAVLFAPAFLLTHDPLNHLEFFFLSAHSRPFLFPLQNFFKHLHLLLFCLHVSFLLLLPSFFLGTQMMQCCVWLHEAPTANNQMPNNVLVVKLSLQVYFLEKIKCKKIYMKKSIR